MRGASALQRVLDDNPAAGLSVFVVWEPVVWTDLGPPMTSVLGLVHDRRARQYWDRERVLSEDILRGLRADPARYSLDEPLPDDTIVWDVVAVFPRGQLWDSDFPPPAYYGAPVVEAIDELRASLAKELER